MYQIQPISFAFRSPYSFNRPGQLPPAGTPAGQGVGVSLNDSGNVVIAGSELQPLQNNSSSTAAQATVPVVDNSKFGDSIIASVIFTNAGLPLDQNGNSITFILPRPNNTRLLLAIVNVSVLGQIFYNFNTAASNTAGIPIGAGGNRIWDTAVPQGNLSLFSTGAGIVQIEYMNNNVS